MVDLLGDALQTFFRYYSNGKQSPPTQEGKNHRNFKTKEIYKLLEKLIYNKIPQTLPCYILPTKNKKSVKIVSECAKFDSDLLKENYLNS